MQRENIKEISTFAALTILFLIFSILFWGHLGNPVIDCGREAYIPEAILNKSVLYKDILCIYGPFSYLINALAYKIFGIHLNTLWAMGTLAAYVIVISFYLISREYLSRSLSAALSVTLMSFCVFMNGIFNYVFPYAYAMTYSLLGFLLSVLFLIKYVKTEKPYFAYLSSFFLGFSVINKYDYLPFVLVLAGIFGFYKKLGAKKITYCFGAFALMPFLTYIYLFFQGVTFKDIFDMTDVVKKMAASPSIKVLYKYSSGTYFSTIAMLLNLKQFVLTTLTLGVVYACCLFAFSLKSKSLRYAILIASFWVFYFMLPLMGSKSDGFSFFPILAALIFLYNIKNCKKEPLYCLLLLCAVFGSFKTFFHLQLAPYGTFTIPLLLIALCVSVKKISDERISLNKNKINFALCWTLAIVSFMALKGTYSQNLNMNNVALQTERGKIYMNPYYGNSHYEFIDFVQRFTKPSDKIAIFPEGPLVNFLTGRKSDDYYNSLIPLYFDTFGEDKIIKHFKKSPPQYVVFNSRSSEDYGARLICVDYAKNFCSWVFDNYEMVMFNGENFKFVVYKKVENK